MRRFVLIASALLGLPAAAAAAPAVLQTPAEALAQDAAEYAARNGLSLDEGIRRLRAQQGSVAATDALRTEFAGRLAGISIQHHPDYRIVVLLTGDAPVRDRFLSAGGIVIPVVFRTGAAATHAELVAALEQRQMEMRAAVNRPQGMGVDARTGEVVVLLRRADSDPLYVAEKEKELTAIAGVPVRIRPQEGEAQNFAVGGGSRVAGVDPRDGRRYACTTGFVVRDASRTGIVTAAHCPDQLTYFAPDGVQTPLSFVGEWGALTQDVQVHATEAARKGEFYVDRDRKVARPLTGWRSRVSTRAGDVVCHRGESSGYSCATVELTDFAPPGTLCGGPCQPVWITVAGPSCRGGDSGGPIFAATTAFGIVKGGSYTPSGACSFYYYMSTDYLPEGWSLLVHQGSLGIR